MDMEVYEQDQTAAWPVGNNLLAYDEQIRIGLNQVIRRVDKFSTVVIYQL